MPIQKWSDNIWVARVGSEPVFSDDIEGLHRSATDHPTMPDIIVDLSQVDHLNSTNLSQLLRLRKALVEDNAKLRLTAPPDSIWVLFLATGLDKVFDFSTDTTTALAELQLGGS